MAICQECGGTVIEYDAAAGNGFCVKCGTVVEENTIVSEITFSESSNGAAMVQGSYVGQGSTHARMGGPFGNRGSSESREQTIANASRKIRNVAAVLRLSEVICAAAVRMYTLAVEHKFTKGRKNMNVIAVCLYVACRQKETRNYMLIDFSDLLQVNVFELGHTYLQLVQTLNLRLPLVDPSHYISRFASLLEFGEATSKVAADAVRLVQRFERDWLSLGRRPAGICGACLLLAARMNNFRRSVAEVVQVVRIADVTLKKRLDEFRKTPSGALTLADFRTVWLEEEVDPPAFTKGREKEAKEAREKEGLGSEDEEDEEELRKRKKKKGQRKKRKLDEEKDEGDVRTVAKTQAPPTGEQHQIPIDPQLLDGGIFAGATTDTPSLFLPAGPDDTNLEEMRMAGDTSELKDKSAETSISPVDEEGDKLLALGNNGIAKTSNELDETADRILVDEVNQFLNAPQGVLVNNELDAAAEEEERRRQRESTINAELTGLDEEELDAFLLSEEEVKIKERVWVEINRDYLEALAAKGEPKEESQSAKSRKRRKTSNKPRDASTPTASTPGEAVRNLIKKNKKYSKRINYEAIKDLFGDVSALAPPNIDLDEKEDDMYNISETEKSDGEGMSVIVEEGGGGVGMAPINTRRSAAASDRSGAQSGGEEQEAGRSEVGVSYDYGESYDDKGYDDYGWDDTYEQEA